MYTWEMDGGMRDDNISLKKETVNEETCMQGSG